MNNRRSKRYSKPLKRLVFCGLILFPRLEPWALQLKPYSILFSPWAIYIFLPNPVVFLISKPIGLRKEILGLRVFRVILGTSIGLV